MGSPEVKRAWGGKSSNVGLQKVDVVSFPDELSAM